MTLSVTFSLLTGIGRMMSDSSGEPQATAVRADDAAGGGAPPRQSPRPSRPVKVTIPSLFVEAPVTGLGLDEEGRLDAPPLNRPGLVGWYRDGPSPGEAGTSLLVGHRDTRTGPAIFLNLNAMRRGDTVKVTRADRHIALFTVDEVKTYTKDGFPDDKVYGATGRPELRLMTCGGRFDEKSGYSANVVVFAHLTSLKGQAV
ncbi:class F sortase [Streptomyces prasinopilosus]|uniref:Sortase family protein n=1 Tax=Streptomyces prasinopilosus TaxID=67344 RepID=A0A1G6TPV3_9ACTN|nr:class F sortase [Streptomyces prasinopilosus]SDD31090.1 Sortase family protein [Streptomyces prasinopilosus]